MASGGSFPMASAICATVQPSNCFCCWQEATRMSSQPSDPVARDQPAPPPCTSSMMRCRASRSPMRARKRSMPPSSVQAGNRLVIVVLPAM